MHMAQGGIEMLEARLRLLASQAVKFLKCESQQESQTLQSLIFGAAGRLVPWLQHTSASQLLQQMMAAGCHSGDNNRSVTLILLEVNIFLAGTGKWEG